MNLRIVGAIRDAEANLLLLVGETFDLVAGVQLIQAEFMQHPSMVIDQLNTRNDHFIRLEGGRIEPQPEDRSRKGYPETQFVKASVTVNE